MTPTTDALRRDPVGFHAGGAHWGLAWAALEWIERTVQPGWTTLEIGSGASTVVFASRGARHHVVTPDPGERDAILARCEAFRIDATGLTFHIGSSHEILPRWEGHPLDLALIDGAHGFPYPVLDWWNVIPHLKVGGHLVLDDAYLPSVAPIVDHCRESAAWRIEEALSFRTAHLVKLCDDPAPFEPGPEAARARMRFAYLPPHRRIVASVRHRVFSTRPGIWAVEQRRARRVDRAHGGE